MRRPPLPPSRVRLRRIGTLRNPGADLGAMPMGLDLAGFSIAEGLRAGLATGAVLALNLWLHSEPVLFAAIGAMITCFCDVGGTVRQRLPMLLSFAALGALTWACFGLLRSAGAPAVILAAAPTLFLFSMARSWGLQAQTVGNVLVVVLALAMDVPLTPVGALVAGSCFLAGGLWACLLTIVIWRIRPDRPVHGAIEQVFGALEALVSDLRALVNRQASQTDWDAHARAHRRAVRAQIEGARSLVGSWLGTRSLASGRAQRAAMLLEAADRLFGELIVLSELLESSEDPGVRQGAERLLRRVRPVLRLLSREGIPDTAKLLTSLERAGAAPSHPALRSLSTLILDHLRVVTRLLDADSPPVPQPRAVRRADDLWRRLWRPLRDELSWRSAILRHAVRATLLTTVAIAVTLVWWTPYAHWLTITVALTMQPFFAATWQRALERIGGTVLGAMLGGALAFLPPTPLDLCLVLLPLSVLGFSVRQVSYGALIACQTPLVVLLFEIVEPGHSPWLVAGMRTAYTLVGGGIAVSACTLLWPSWEPDRLRRELRTTLLAYRQLAAAVLASPPPERAADTEVARREVGLANNNLEASLSRALQEPGRGRRRRLLPLIAADAALRRLGAILLAVPHDQSAAALLEGPARDDWARYIDAALVALAEGGSAPAAPSAPPASTLSRARRALDLLATDLATADLSDTTPHAATPATSMR